MRIKERSLLLLLLLYHLRDKYQGNKNKGNDHQHKKLWIVKQILLISTLGNTWKKVWRMCLSILGCKRTSSVDIFFVGCKWLKLSKLNCISKSSEKPIHDINATEIQTISAA